MNFPRKTNAAVLFETKKPLEVVEIDIPQLKPGQVLVEIAYSGVCRTQLLEIEGKKGPDRYLPHTLGHEGSGIVISKSSDVEKVKVGDHVVITWIKGAGFEVPSTSYTCQEKTINSGAVSTFQKLCCGKRKQACFYR